MQAFRAKKDERMCQHCVRMYLPHVVLFVSRHLRKYRTGNSAQLDANLRKSYCTNLEPSSLGGMGVHMCIADSYDLYAILQISAHTSATPELIQIGQKVQREFGALAWLHYVRERRLVRLGFFGFRVSEQHS